MANSTSTNAHSLNDAIAALTQDIACIRQKMALQATPFRARRARPKYMSNRPLWRPSRVPTPPWSLPSPTLEKYQRPPEEPGARTRSPSEPLGAVGSGRPGDPRLRNCDLATHLEKGIA